MKKITFLFLCVSVFAFGQKEVQVDLSTPHAAIYTHLYFLQPDSYQPEKAAKTILGLPKEEAVKKAIKIKQVLDGKGLFVDFNKIPTNPNYNDTIGYTKTYKYILFPIRMPSIAVEKVGDNWYYTTETVNGIDSLYTEVFPWYVQRIQKMVPNVGHKKAFGIELWQIVMLFLLVILCIGVFFIVKAIAFFVLQKIQYRITKSRNVDVNKVLKKLAHPISLLVAIKFIEKIFPSLNFSLAINKWVFLSLNIAATVFWIYVFLKLVQVVMRIYAEFTERTHGKLDDQLVPILHKFLTALVIVLGALKLLTLLGIDTTAVIAGISIGGLALALASQDTVKNLIGTTMIFFDKPFHIGDWIEAEGISGTVEEVGFRSTKIRGADTSVYQIPNSKLSEIVVNNKGLRQFRRYTTKLGLRYDTPPELIEAFACGVRKLIVAHPATSSNAFNVEFTEFADSSLLIMVNVYFIQLDWTTEQSSRHRLHIAILKLAKELGVDFAFPSSTLMMEQFPEKKSLNLKYDISQQKIDAAIAKIVDDFSKKNQ